MCKYFNQLQRLIDADGRFARDIEYLLTAQYAVKTNMLLRIHKRHQQLKIKGDDATFGDVSILAVGDLCQLYNP